MFTDLDGFTSLSEVYEPEVVVELLNEYLSRMNAIIAKRGGLLARYEADAFMVIFGFPPVPDYARHAVKCAIDMQESVLDFREGMCRNRGWPAVFFRVGMATGRIYIGPLGSDQSMNPVGHAVSLAQGLEPQNRKYGSAILCCERTFDQTRDLVVADAIPNVRYHNEGSAVTAYRVRGMIETGARDHLWRSARKGE